MPVDTELVPIENPSALNVILGQTHFIKTAEDVHEALVGAVPGIHFGVAFCEASGPCLVRVEGNAEDLKSLAAKNALAVGAGHFFIVFLRDAFPINVLPALRDVPEVVTIFAATANPVDVVVAKTPRGRGVLGVVDRSGRRASRERRTGRIGSRSSGRSDTSWADMCRMLGLVSRKPVPVDTLMAFRQLADTGRNFRDFGCPQPNPKSGHPDGWGIACVGAEGEFYVRGPGRATTDPRYEEAV